MQTGASFIWGKAKRLGTIQAGEEKTHNDFLNVCKYLKGRYTEEYARLFWVVARDKSRSMATKWNIGVYLWTSRNIFYCEGDQVLAQVAQRCCGVSVIGGIKKLSGYVLGQRVAGIPAWARVLDQTASTGSFKPQPFCDLFWVSEYWWWSELTVFE